MATHRHKKKAKKNKQQATARRIQRPEDDTLEHLRNQIRFISRASRAYDSGDPDEAANIANHICMVLHDTGLATSLLTQMEKKDIPFDDTSFPMDPRDKAPYQGLVATELSANPKWGWIPLCFGGDEPNAAWKTFDEWWNAIILDDKKAISFTRRSLILAVRNQEGGAHIDPEIDEQYVKIEKMKEFAFTFAIGDQEIKPRVGAGLASVRQIAFEALKTLGTEYPSFLKGKYLQPKAEAVLGPNATIVGGLQFIQIDNPDDVKEQLSEP